MFPLEEEEEERAPGTLAFGSRVFSSGDRRAGPDSALYMEVEHTLRRFVAAGMQTRNAELSWMRVCCVFGVVLYHSIQSMLDVTDWQGTPQLKQKISSSMQFLSGCIVPGLFACIAEVAMVTTEPCTFSSKPANAPLKLRQVMEWYYHVIVSPANWNLLPSFLFTYLLLIKLDVYFNLLGGVGSFTEFYVQNWAVSYAWFPMYLWGMFIVNGFYLGSMGGYGFAAVLAKAAVFVLPYTLALSSGSDSGLVLGSLASFLLPYVCIYLCSKFSPGSLLVCWVNMLVLFGCNCLSSFLLEQASSTPTLLRWITMNHYFLLGMITSTMVECHEQHPTWARGLGLCALLALITTQSYTDPETTGCWHRALSTWTWVFTLRCVSRAIFADYLKNKKTCRAENFLRESWLHIYLLHVPFVHLCKHLFSVPQGEEPWGIVPAASLTLLLSLVASLILCTTYRLILRPAFFRAGVSLGWWPR